MDKFKVGDKVRSKCYGEGKVVEEMGGEILVQFEKSNSNLHSACFSKTGPYRDNTCYWYKRDTNQLKIVKEEYTYEDLKKSPIGTKITFQSGITLIKVDKENYKEIKEYGTTRYIELLKGLKDNWQFMNQGRIIKIEEPKYTTVYECEPEILDEVEKRYLSNVIRPFRDKVKYIVKYHSTTICEECILIHISNNPNIMLPYFKEDSMYKGMESGKEYTLEELGL